MRPDVDREIECHLNDKGFTPPSWWDFISVGAVCERSFNKLFCTYLIALRDAHKGCCGWLARTTIGTVNAAVSLRSAGASSLSRSLSAETEERNRYSSQSRSVTDQ